MVYALLNFTKFRNRLFARAEYVLEVILGAFTLNSVSIGRSIMLSSSSERNQAIARREGTYQHQVRYSNVTSNCYKNNKHPDPVCIQYYI